MQTTTLKDKASSVQIDVDAQSHDLPKKHTHTLRRFAGRKADPSQTIGLRADHPAVLDAHSIFRKSVVKPGEAGRVLVSGHNNPKLGAKVQLGRMAGFPLFHLTLEERATCPRSCSSWLSCYGNAMPFARRNDASDPERLVTAIGFDLAALQRRHPGGFLVRVHTLGDFFSTAYVAAWARWLERFPALHVFGYSSCTPDAADPRERAIGHAVADLAEANWDRFAIRFSRAVAAPGGAVVVDAPPGDDAVLMCPAQTGKTECCATCGLCWSAAASVRGRAIGFLRHGMKRPRGRRKAEAA